MKSLQIETNIWIIYPRVISISFCSLLKSILPAAGRLRKHMCCRVPGRTARSGMHMCPHQACSWAASRAWGLHWPWKQTLPWRSLCELQARTGWWFAGCPGCTPKRQGGTCFLKHSLSRAFPVSACWCCSGWVRVPLFLVYQPHLSEAAGCTGVHADGESEVSSGPAPTAQLHGSLHSPEREQLAMREQGQRQGAPLLRGIQNLEQVETAMHRRAVWGAKADHGEGCIYLYNICIVRTN